MSTTDWIEFLIIWLSFIALLHSGMWAYYYFDEKEVNKGE